MKDTAGFVAIAVLALATASEAAAGTGVWTPTANTDAVSVVVGADGAVVADWGRGDVWLSFQIARSTDHGATWQPSDGPGSVGTSFYSTRALAVDPAGAIYAEFTTSGLATYHAHLFVSRDAGSTWTQLLEEFQTQYGELRVDPFSSQILYLRDGPLAPSRLTRSDDAGAHWNEIDGGLGVATGSFVTALALDPSAPGRVYAATGGPSGIQPSVPGLFSSSDRGSTWAREPNNPPSILTTLVVDPLQPSRLVGGGPSGIFQSLDSGRSFVAATGTPTAQIVADPVHAGRLYAATAASGVLASSDGGATWSALNPGLTNYAVNAVALDPAGGYLYAATNTGVFVYGVPDPGTLVLDAAHLFSVTLSATDQRTGRTGAGVANKVNDLWGYFSIPAITNNPSNPEVFVKLLDGTAINGRYWFFYGGLTDLEYTLTVMDDATGLTRTYSNPAGSECGGSDTAAFAP